MQFLVDFFPLLAFLGTYLQTNDIFVSLQVLMVAMPVAFVIKWRLTRKIDKMLLGSTVLLLVLGAATLLFRDPVFLFWKPTALYWLAAAVFLGTQFFASKPAIQHLFASIGEMSAANWSKLNAAWIVFFLFSGALNLYVAYNFSEAFWVKFKVLGFTAITFVFIIAQMLWLFRLMKHDKAQEPEAD